MKNKKGNKLSAHNPFIKYKLIIYLLFLVILPSALYFRVVYFAYSGLDDITIIYNVNNVEGSPLNLKNAFTHDAFMGDRGDTFYRPIQLISLMLDAEVGGRQPWIYHLSNLILHILTVIALFFFLKKTGVKEEISFFLALIFSVSPLFTNAVAWIPARGDILLCLFSLVSFITIIDYFETRKAVYAFLHAVVFLMAIFSKETAVLLPVLIVSYLYFVMKKAFKLKDIFPILMVWIISFILFFSLRQTIIKVNPSSNIFGIVPFIKNLPVIPITFFKFFFPYRLSTMPFFDNIGIISGIVLLAIFAGIIFRFMSGNWRIVLWAGVWFLAFSIPPMFYRSYFASIGYDYFEYRAYLPIAGILLITGLLLNDKPGITSFKRLLIVFVPIILIYSIIAFIHSNNFADPFSFFNSAIKTSSGNAMALAERGTIYFEKGDKERALSDFDNSIKICSTNPIPYYNKGIVYGILNDHNQAEYLFSEALKNDTISQDLHLLRSEIYLKLSDEKLNLRKFDETRGILKKAMKMYPENSELHNKLGLVYYNTMNFDSAFYEYNKAIEYDKNVFTYYDNRGMAEFHLKDYKSALNDFNRVIDMKPDFKDTWGSRGMTKLELNDYEGAIYDLTKAISFNPGDGAAYYFRGVAYSRLKMIKEARTDWEKAVELGNKNAGELLKKEVIY